jgi:hypothetical protein
LDDLHQLGKNVLHLFWNATPVKKKFSVAIRSLEQKNINPICTINYFVIFGEATLAS